MLVRPTRDPLRYTCRSVFSMARGYTTPSSSRSISSEKRKTEDPRIRVQSSTLYRATVNQIKLQRGVSFYSFHHGDKAKEYFGNIYSALSTIFIGMKITFKHMFVPSVTIQYPEVKPQLPERERNRLLENGYPGNVPVKQWLLLIS